MPAGFPFSSSWGLGSSVAAALPRVSLVTPSNQRRAGSVVDALRPTWTALGVTGSVLGVRPMILDSLKLNWDSITPTFLPSILERTLPENLVPLAGSLNLVARGRGI